MKRGGNSSNEQSIALYGMARPAAAAATAGSSGNTMDSRSSSTGSKQAEVDMLLAELAELKDENNKLRQIQDQFWLLLYEREDLQKELETQRAAASKAASSSMSHNATARPSTSAVGSSSLGNGFGGVGETDHKMEYDIMSTALQECMELLMSKELQTTLQSTELGSRGTVRAFLSWLQLSHERSSALYSLATARDEAGIAGSLSPKMSKTIGVFSSTYGIGSVSKEEKEALLRELHHAKQELKQLQEELDRTDLSRMQALEDAERMQQHIEVLSKGVQELRTAYNGLKSQAESSGKNAQLVQQLKGQLAERDSVIHELRAKLSQYQRLSDVGSAELAADAARIRQQLAERAGSQGGSQQNIMLSP